MTNIPFRGNFAVTCRYRKTGNWQAGFHTVIDLYGLSSSEVYSVCDGIVKDIIDSGKSGYGLHVKIKENYTGKVFLFAHLKDVNVVKKQSITRNTKIGTMGNTGNVIASKGGDGTHLHIELRTDNDKYGEVEDITAYMGLPNIEGTYNSNNYSTENIKNTIIKKNSPNLTYTAHCQNLGWQEEKKKRRNGRTIWTRTKNRGNNNKCGYKYTI